MLELKDIQAAAAVIKGYVRRTPLIEARPVKVSPGHPGPVFLKLENLQITGSFKARGAVNKLFNLNPEEIARGIVTASGGNHGLGVAYAGWLSRTSATIYLPLNTPPVKAQKLAAWGARVITGGAVWDDANKLALAAAEASGLTYFHPFADPKVIAGQGTISLEILEDRPDIDVLLVAIGGGGLISGVSLAAKAINPRLKIIGVEPAGAPTLYESIKAGHLVELTSINTAANTLAPRLSAEINFEIIHQNVDEIVLVTDAEMLEAARWLWQEMNIAPELSGAASMAALLAGKLNLPPEAKVGVLVCGTGTDAF